jgi:spore germination protein GerM
MKFTRPLTIAALAGVTAVLLWIMFVGLPRWYGRRTASANAGQTSGGQAEPGRKIKARLFYIADGGTRLVGVDREVPYGENAVDQARALVAAEIAPATEPVLSPFPAGTALRALFVSNAGEAFVDLSRDVSTGHPGGSRAEMLTAYAVVNVLTTNLPAITSVQLLVDGKEVETLAGHLDLRRPLAKNAAIIEP